MIGKSFAHRGRRSRRTTGWAAIGAALAIAWPGAPPAHAAQSPGAASAAPVAAVTAVRFGTLIDGKGGVWRDGVVLVEGERIRAAGPAVRVKIPAGARVIDLRRYTGIPGLIDSHTHLTYAWDRAPGTSPWQALGARRPAEIVFIARENARRTLEAGVTTVRDLGSFDYMDIAMRNLIATGAMPGPRMYVSGYGLHPTNIPHGSAGWDYDGGKADGVEQVLRVVRENIAAGADVIKVYGSTGSGDDVTGEQTYTFEEMKAAVDAARARGRTVSIHSYGPEGARDAVRAGASSVEHAVDLDDATLREMARRGTYYVPTVDHNRYYAEHATEFGYDSAAVARLDGYRARNLETLRRAIRANVRIAMGSDALFGMCGENARELGWFVKAGMTPAQALAAATGNGAALLGKERELGAVAPGYLADIVAVEGDPLADIAVVIRGVVWVMKGGAVVVDRAAGP